MILRRKEAIILSSFYKFLNLSPEERAAKIENALAEKSLETGDVAPEVSNYYARKYIEYEFSFYLNSYLQTFLSNQLGIVVEVKGKGPKLLPCVCCGYKTLMGTGWEICDVCFWEDDGVTELHKISGANHISLFEATENFKKLGVVEDGCQEFVDPDRMSQYGK
ncbi:CPCC family cysteine-rich protein [Mucilaginibacter sp. AW1-3]